jgi:hypothetical protein
MPGPHDPAESAAPENPRRQSLQAAWRAYRSRPRARVKWWLALLLLFAPVFYPLLYLKPYSLGARVGWGLWLGLIVFVKAMGYSEPVIDLRPGLEDAPASREVGLAEYLGRLEGGVLGARVADFQEDGRTLTVRFRRAEGYLDSERDLALAGVGTGFSLLYGRGYDTVVLRFDRGERPVRMRLERAAFARFFGLSGDQMAALASDWQRFQTSPVKTISPERQQAFYEAFARPE